MPSSGVFVTLYDLETLTLYLDRGLYGFLMTPVRGAISSRSRHFHALGDYACIREDTHVFFFLKRHIVYGGQALGTRQHGSFYLNGCLSPYGSKAKAPLCWDESKRQRYTPTEETGIFKVPNANGEEKEKCQPYLIQFQDQLGLKGKAIPSDDLYWRLGDYGYPLPSNAIQDMSFCTLTPRETDIALSLLTEKNAKQFPVETPESISLEGQPALFSPECGTPDLQKAFENNQFVNEAHLEASVVANPNLLPPEMRPQAGDTICRQMPVSPFKPAQMDRADICYFSKNLLGDGTIPNVLIELKNCQAKQDAVEQVIRYLTWFYRIAPKAAEVIRGYVFAPSFARNVRVGKYANQIQLMTPSGNLETAELL